MNKKSINKVVLAYSGGLDTSIIIPWLKENYGCDACGKACLTDRKGQRFPLLREWQHRNLIMNSQPTYMGDKRDELLRAHIGHEHFIFSSESVGEIEALLGAYKSGTPWDKPHRRIGKR